MALELALAGDFRIAQPGTLLGLQEVTLGLIPDVGGTTRLTKLVGPVKAKELILTAKQIDAEEARQIQLVNQVEDDCLAGAWALAGQINKNAPLAVGLVKKLINRGQHLDQRSFMELEAIAQTTILYSEDVKEGMLAKMEKREPVFKGK
jgi:enoyl-CoA hydratase/carnithine racemase